MSEVADVLKTVKELSEDTREKKVWFALFVISSTVIFIFSNINLLPHLSINSSIDQVFINFIVLLLSFMLGSILTSALFFVWNLLCTGFKRVISLKRYSWKLESGIKDFEFQGNVVVDKTERAIHIIQSDLGFILKNKDWKNYEMEFIFKVPKKPKFSPEDEEGNQWKRGFGVIYRSKKLGEYFMLKIDINGYHPHVRQVLWENNGPIFYTSLSTEDLGKWIKAKLVMKNNFLKVKVGNDEFEFFLPTHSNISRDYSIENDNQEFENRPYSKINFRNFGSVGFRSASFEEVYIKNLRVKNIFSLSALFLL